MVVGFPVHVYEDIVSTQSVYGIKSAHMMFKLGFSCITDRLIQIYVHPICWKLVQATNSVSDSIKTPVLKTADPVK